MRTRTSRRLRPTCGASSSRRQEGALVAWSAAPRCRTAPGTCATTSRTTTPSWRRISRRPPRTRRTRRTRTPRWCTWRTRAGSRRSASPSGSGPPTSTHRPARSLGSGSRAHPQTAPPARGPTTATSSWRSSAPTSPAC